MCGLDLTNLYHSQPKASRRLKQNSTHLEATHYHQPQQSTKNYQSTINQPSYQLTVLLEHSLRIILIIQELLTQQINHQT